MIEPKSAIGLVTDGYIEFEAFVWSRRLKIAKEQHDLAREIFAAGYAMGYQKREREAWEV